MNGETRERTWRVSEGVAMTLIAVGLQAMWLVWESGRAAHFRVPFRFITPELSALLGQGVVFAVLIGSLLWMAYGFWLMAPGIRGIGVRYLALGLVASAAVVYVGDRAFQIAGGLILVAIVLWEGGRLWRVHCTGTLPARITARRAALEKSRAAFEERLGLPRHTVALMLPALVFAILTVRQMGREAARQETQFAVLSGQPARLLVGIYGDTAVAAPFDREGKRIRPERCVLNLRDLPPFQLEELGPMQLDQPRPGGPLSCSN